VEITLMITVHQTPFLSARSLMRGVRGVAILLLVALSAGIAQAASTSAAGTEDTTQARQWITQMKDSARGPFLRIRWFCKDGRVLEPKDYACAKKGEGWQHGEWSERTKQLRAQGYFIANVLAGLDARAAVAAPDFAERYAQLLVEKFLIAADDGWILRKARFYRGAIQEEDERDAARALLTEMASRDEWIGWRFAALRAGVRLLPHGRDTASAQKVRNMAAALADRDPAFAPLRVKIHGSPDGAEKGGRRAGKGNRPGVRGGAAAQDPGSARQAVQRRALAAAHAARRARCADAEDRTHASLPGDLAVARQPA